MTTAFPGDLDNFTNPTSANNLDSVGVVHHEQHANVNDAVEAMEAKIGKDGSAVTSSHDYKIAANAFAIASESSARSSADTAESSARISGDAASVSTASSDATSKANAAYSAAIADAASDATTKANAAAAASLPLHATADDSAKLGGTTPSAYGLTIIDDTDATAARSTLGLGTLATQSGTFSGTSSGTNTGDQTNIAGNAATCDLAADSTKLAGVTPGAGGLSLLDDTDATAMRSTLGLGTLATQSGTFSGTSSGTNTGDQSSIVGITGSLSDFNNALTGADFATGGGTVTGTSSGTNTGDQTNISGNAATATLAADSTKLANTTPGAGGLSILDDTDATAMRSTLGLGTLATQSGTFSGTSSGTNTGDQTNISGNAATVTTNANLTGPITSSGNATAVASQTGTGSKFVMDTSPTLITPVLGVAAATSLATSAASPLLMTNGQLATVALTGQTVGGATLTIPDFASISDEFTFKTKSQTMSNKTFVAPALGTPASGIITNLTGKARGAATAQLLDSSVIGPVSFTNDTGAKTYATHSIAAGHGLTNGSRIIISFLWSNTSSANNKALNVKIGSTVVWGSASVTNNQTIIQKDVLVYIRDITNSQVFWPLSNVNTYGVQNGLTVATAALDLSGAFTITIVGQMAASAETCTLEGSVVRFEIV